MTQQPNDKISQLPLATSPGTESYVPIVVDGVTKRITPEDLVGDVPGEVTVADPTGTTLEARPLLRFFDQKPVDNGDAIYLSQPQKNPRVRVRGIRTTNIADFDVAAQVADGLTLQRGHMFWAAGQTTASENGLYYVYQTLGTSIVQCIKLTGLMELATSSEGGLLVWVRGGNTLPGTMRRVTNFAAASAALASTSQPFSGVDFGSVDIEDYATITELATAEANQNWEPAFRRAQDALRDGGGEIRVGHRRYEYRSTARWKIKAGITIRGMGSGLAYGAKLTYAACGGIKTFYPPTQLREYCVTIDTSGGATSGLSTINGVAVTAGQRVLRVTSARTTQTTASFVQPVVGANVSVAVASSAGQTVSSNISVLLSGHYQVVSIDDPTHITIKLIADAASVTAGDTIASGTTLGGDINDGLWLAQVGAWTRPTDYDTSAEIDPGIRTKVRFGTHAGEFYDQHTREPITLGTTPILWILSTGNVGEEDSDPSIPRISGVYMNMTGTPGDLNDACGLTTQSPTVLENVFISSFSGHGILIDAGAGRIPPTASNRNQFINVRCSNNGLCGIRFDGPDGNASCTTGVSCTSNGTRGVSDEDWGVKDDSFLGGNDFVGGSFSSNGGAVKAINPNQRSVFVGCYAESDNLSDIGPPNVNLNSRADLRVGATSTAIPGVIGETSGIGLSSPVVRSGLTGAGVITRLGLFGTDQVINFQTVPAGDTSGYIFGWAPAGGGGSSQCWMFAHAGLNARRAFGLTGPSHARSHSQPIALLGMVVGQIKLHAVTSSAGLPASSSTDTGSGTQATGVYASGDLMFNSGWQPGTGLPWGWTCTNTAGTLTWTPLYVGNAALDDRTAQTASIGAVTLLSAPAAGLYEVDVNLECTTADAGAVSVLATLGFTDRSGARTKSTSTLALTATNSQATRFVIRIASGDLTFSTTVNTAGTSVYAITVRARRIG